MNDDRFFTRLAEHTDAVSDTFERAPARLNSRLYSALVVELAATWPPRTLPSTSDARSPPGVFDPVLPALPARRFPGPRST